MSKPDAISSSSDAALRPEPLLAALEENLARSGSTAAPLRALLDGKLTPDHAALLFARAPRLTGKGEAYFTAEQLAAAGMPVAGWSADLLARVVLLVRLAREPDAMDAGSFDAWLDRVYRHGEARERVAVLRALPLLPDPQRFEALAADACRNHVVPVVEAITCDNPYPFRYFSDHTFRHMVLKAIFVELPIARIMGLSQRADAELARMARSYVSERRAAGRSVPDDALWLSRQGDLA